MKKETVIKIIKIGDNQYILKPKRAITEEEFNIFFQMLNLTPKK